MNPEAVAHYGRLGSIMAPGGSIELPGCDVASGRNGYTLLRMMARATGVPVTAGLGSQRGGRRASRFEGAVLTRFPRQESLRTWAERVFTACV